MKPFSKSVRIFLVVSALAALIVVTALAVGPGLIEKGQNQVEPPTEPVKISQKAGELHQRLFVADMHCDLLMWGRDPLVRAERGHTDVPRLIQGNVGLQVFAAVTKVPKGLNYEQNPSDSDALVPLFMVQGWPMSTWTGIKARALFQARKLRDAANRSSGKLRVITSLANLEAYLKDRAAGEKGLAGVLALEGLQVLEGDLASLDELFAAGYRIAGLTHFFDNEVAGSAHGVAKGGLTALGREVVRRTAELGMIVDLAHASPQAVDDVLVMTRRPVIVSHTGVQARCPGPRNLTDDQMRRIAATGGVIGVGYWEGAICDISPASFARTVRYTADTVGVAHVGLGSDFDGATTTRFNATGLAQITQALLDVGFSDTEIAAIMGQNVLRLLRVTLPQNGGFTIQKTKCNSPVWAVD